MIPASASYVWPDGRSAAAGDDDEMMAALEPQKGVQQAAAARQGPPDGARALGPRPTLAPPVRGDDAVAEQGFRFAAPGPDAGGSLHLFVTQRLSERATLVVSSCLACVLACIVLVRAVQHRAAPSAWALRWEPASQGGVRACRRPASRNVPRELDRPLPSFVVGASPSTLHPDPANNGDGRCYCRSLTP
ncbi:hypothetical protein ACCO45_004672 [Purpureocillium lilacinum]|uniref:Uncharacterized protein n=1 Tax=Purpureocillium lilacinum TaxID=33203 RepID=A0ACC4DW56_PURLI